MTSITWTAVASDLLGRGGTDVRGGGLIMSGPAAPIQGTGLPSPHARAVPWPPA